MAFATAARHRRTMPSVPDEVFDECHLDPSAARAAVLHSLAPWRQQAVEGQVRLVFLAPPAVVRAGFDLAEPVVAADELYLRDLLARAVEVGTPAVTVVLARAAGRALRSDRRFGAELRRRFDAAPVRLVDVLVVGPDAHVALGPRRG
jgi:hypothetical protein